MNLFPQDPKTYREFFEEIAKQHPAIQATDDNGRFSCISQSQAPFGTWDLKEFMKKKASVTKTSEQDPELVFVLIMMDDDEHDQGTTINGSFILLRKCKYNDYEAVTQAYTDARKTGRQIMCWLRKFFSMNREIAVLDREKTNDEPVGPVNPDNMFGYIFNFSYLFRESQDVDPEVWDDFLPYKVEL